MTAPEARLEFMLYDTPAPQGSKRHVGGGRMVESSKAVKPWREAVKHAALMWGDGVQITGPIAAQLTFTVRKPAGAPKRRRTWPATRPDLDKLVRSTFDALTASGVWHDDGQVVQLLASKTYPNEGPNSLDRPGVIVRLYEIKEDASWPSADVATPAPAV